MKHKQLSHAISQATEGVLSTVTDMMLTQIFFLLMVPGRRSPAQIQEAGEEAFDLVSHHVNYQSIKRALFTLKKHGLIERKKNASKTEIAITNAGKQRIDALFPVYHTDRPWDGHVYLTSYDIPTKANRSRNVLRTYIKRIGGALLQESLWMNPYNPTQLLEDFAKEHGIPGTILISKLSTDGAIGIESLPDVIRRIYKLDALAKRYEEFIQTYTTPPRLLSRWKLSIDYFAILSVDPQLPFPLLPKDFPAEKAYLLYQKRLKY